MPTLCFQLAIILCLSATAVSGVSIKPVRSELVSAAYTAMQYTIEEKMKAGGIPTKAGFEYVISEEFLGKAPIPLDAATYDSEALAKFPGIFAFGVLEENFGGVLKALHDMTLAGYPGQSILIIYALDYWAVGQERSQSDRRFYKESMKVLLSLKASGARVYQFSTEEDFQSAQAKTDVCLPKEVPNLIKVLYDSRPGLMYVDGWIGSHELKSEKDILKMQVSTTGLHVVVTSLRNIIVHNSRQDSPVVGIYNHVNSGLPGTDGFIVAAQHVRCKYLFSMFVLKPFVHTTLVEELMKKVTVIVMFLQPKVGSSANFYDTALKSSGLTVEEIAALKFYQAKQKTGKRFVVHEHGTPEILV